MNEVVVAALVGGAVSVLLWAGNKVTGGARRERVDTDGSVASQWQAWSQEQGKRIDALEDDVADLKKDLAAERDKNHRQSTLMRSLVRWALQLRDEVIRLRGVVPPAPPEVEAAMTNLEP